MTVAIELARIAHRVIADYMAVKPGEKVVIVVDSRTSPSIPTALGDSAAGYGGSVVSDVRLDGMILGPRVEIDGEAIVEGGEVRE
ncbi:MAG: hypothetical protein ACREGL_10070 [Alphaproteobacteria bacterium]